MPEKVTNYRQDKERIINDLLLPSSCEPVVNRLRIKRYLEFSLEEFGFHNLNSNYFSCPEGYEQQWEIELSRFQASILNSMVSEVIQFNYKKPNPYHSQSLSRKKEVNKKLLDLINIMNNICNQMSFTSKLEARAFRQSKFESPIKELNNLLQQRGKSDHPNDHVIAFKFVESTYMKDILVFNTSDFKDLQVNDQEGKSSIGDELNPGITESQLRATQIINDNQKENRNVLNEFHTTDLLFEDQQFKNSKHSIPKNMDTDQASQLDDTKENQSNIINIVNHGAYNSKHRQSLSQRAHKTLNRSSYSQYS